MGKKNRNSIEAIRGIQAWKEQRARQEKFDAHDLLHKVIMAVLNSGNEHLLRGVEGLHAYMGAHIPTLRGLVEDKIGRQLSEEELSGEVAFDGLVIRYVCSRRINAACELKRDVLAEQMEEQLRPPPGAL